MKPTTLVTKIFLVSSFSFLTLLGVGQVGVISTIAGTNVGGYNGDGGQAVNAELYDPEGVAVDATGNIYVADAANHRIRKIDLLGVITTVAGNGTAGNTGDGGQAVFAQLNYPDAIAFDTAGNLFIADETSYCIRKVNTSGVISTVAGNGSLGYSGDGGAATSAQLNLPAGVTVDEAGNIYIADSNNNRVRKVNTSGIISTYAGTGAAGFSGDGGTAITAAIQHPTGITLDPAGNLFIAAWGNNRIREVDTLGIINTIAGNGTAGFGGDGGQAINAEFSNPFSVTFDAAGNLYVADFMNNRIRKIDTTGIITTVAGNGIAGFSGDGGQAVLAELHHPGQVVFDAQNNMIIADFVNARVRKVIGSSVGINEIQKSNIQISIYPNPSARYLNVITKDKIASVSIFDIDGNLVEKINIQQTGEFQIDISDLSPGVYSIEAITAENKSSSSKLVKR